MSQLLVQLVKDCCTARRRRRAGSVPGGWRPSAAPRVPGGEDRAVVREELREGEDAGHVVARGTSRPPRSWPRAARPWATTLHEILGRGLEELVVVAEPGAVGGAAGQEVEGETGPPAGRVEIGDVDDRHPAVGVRGEGELGPELLRAGAGRVVRGGLVGDAGIAVVRLAGAAQGVGIGVAQDAGGGEPGHRIDVRRVALDDEDVGRGGGELDPVAGVERVPLRVGAGEGAPGGRVGADVEDHRARVEDVGRVEVTLEVGGELARRRDLAGEDDARRLLGRRGEERRLLDRVARGRVAGAGVVHVDDVDHRRAQVGDVELAVGVRDPARLGAVAARARRRPWPACRRRQRGGSAGVFCLGLLHAGRWGATAAPRCRRGRP